MPNPERPFSFGHNEINTIILAHSFTGEDLPEDMNGYIRAKEVLEEQHQRVRFTVPPEVSTRIVSEGGDSFSINTLDTLARLSIQTGDYDTAMATSNQLYFLGDIDYQDGLGGGAIFTKSLETHRLFAERVEERFGGQNMYLRTAGKHLFVESTAAHSRGDFVTEQMHLRGIIHSLALDGTFGPDVKKRVDPYAILTQKK